MKLSLRRCQDYILIDRGTSRPTEICGNSSNDSTSELQLGNFTVIFRTSEEKKSGGFVMYIVCFREEDRDRRSDSLPSLILCITLLECIIIIISVTKWLNISTGCLTPMDFNSSVCSDSGGGDQQPQDNSNAPCVWLWYLTLGVHAQRGYCSWVCLSVCLSVTLYLTPRTSVRPRNNTIYLTGDEVQKTKAENAPLLS